MSITQSLTRIDSFLSQNNPEILAKFGDGLSDEQINHLTKHISSFLPELHELYKWHNSSRYNQVFGDYYFDSLEEAMEKYRIFSEVPSVWKLSLLPFATDDKQDILLVDCSIKDSPVWYNFLEDPTMEIFWSSITKMIQTIADAYEMGAYSSDNNYYIMSDRKKFLEAMWKNDPDIINSLIKQLRTVKEDRLNNMLSPVYENISRFVWQDISKLFDGIASTGDKVARGEMLNEFSSIFLNECDRIMNRIY